MKGTRFFTFKEIQILEKIPSFFGIQCFKISGCVAVVGSLLFVVYVGSFGLETFKSWLVSTSKGLEERRKKLAWISKSSGMRKTGLEYLPNMNGLDSW